MNNDEWRLHCKFIIEFISKIILKIGLTCDDLTKLRAYHQEYNGLFLDSVDIPHYPPAGPDLSGCLLYTSDAADE